jgi:DNA-directed RNA polymerase subunit K/omega
MSEINFANIEANQNNKDISSEHEHEEEFEFFENENHIDNNYEDSDTENEEDHREEENAESNKDDEDDESDESNESDEVDEVDEVDEDTDDDDENNNITDGGRKKDIPLIIDFKQKVFTSCINRITRPILTKYEKTLILGQRAQQILKGSNILVHVEKLKNRNPLEIARFELSQGVIPFIIRRPLPNGQYEDWKVNELKDINN